MKDTRPVIHLVTHTHWDREWYLTYQQFRLKLVRMIDHVLNLFDHDPNFLHFMLDGQTIVLEDYLELRPDKAAQLRDLILQGKILIGPWYILPDEFLVSPEAIVRNLLEGDRTAKCFGSKMMVGYVPDPFGHIGQLPQIFRGFGIDSACVQRGLDDQPVEFIWQSPDGSSVLMAYLRDGYGNAAGLPASDTERFNIEINRLKSSLAGNSAIPDEHLLLMHGTDHTEPAVETSDAIDGFNNSDEKGWLVHSTLPAYVNSIREALLGIELPTVIGELRSPKRSPMLPGVLSARTWIKQRNFTCQNLLEKYAEPLSAWASILLAMKSEGPRILPRPVIHDPQPILRSAWRLLLQNHPHDSICGCSIDQVHNEMRPRFDQVEQIGEELLKQGLAVIADAIKTLPPASSTPRTSASIVVYNPTASITSGPVEIDVEIPPGMTEFEIIDELGNHLPLQTFGLGSHELINVELDAKALKEAFGMLSAGKINGMIVCSIHVKQDGNTVRIELSLSDSGEPNMDEWNRAVETIEALFTSPSVSQYIVTARSVPSAKVLLLANDIPGCGYRTFWVRGIPASPGSEPTRLTMWAKAALPIASKVAQTLQWTDKQSATERRQNPKAPYRIENEYLSIEVSSKDGSFLLTDKRTGTKYSNLNRFFDGGDCGDEYNFSPPPDDKMISCDQVRQVFIDNGSVQSKIEISLTLEIPNELTPNRKSRSPKHSTLHITTTVILTKGIPRVDIRTRVHNHSIKDHRLRVHFPAPFKVENAEMDGHFEIVKRSISLPDYDTSWIEEPRPEHPQRMYTRINNGQVGLMVANCGLPEIEVLNNPQGHTELALSLLRCVGWLSRDDFSTRRGHAGPFLATPEAQNPGEYIFEYSIIPYGFDETQSAVHLAEAFCAPLRSVSTEQHAGKLPASESFLSIDPGEFCLTTIKPAENARGVIVRGYNPTGSPLMVKMKTLLPFSRASLVNLMEEPIEELPAQGDGSFITIVGGRKIISILLEHAS